MTLDDPKHPVASVINMARSLPIDQYVNIFGDKELDEIIEEYKERATVWKNDANSLLDFVSWNCFFYEQFYLQLIKNDLMINAWKYIETDLAGNIDSYLRMFPEELLKTAFSPSSFYPDDGNCIQ